MLMGASYTCKQKNCADGIAYLLYALSVSGTAYVFQLKNISAYGASFVFSSDEVLHFDTKISSDCGPISTVTATAGCLVIGRYDGSVSCFRVGLVKDAPGRILFIAYGKLVLCVVSAIFIQYLFFDSKVSCMS